MNPCRTLLTAAAIALLAGCAAPVAAPPVRTVEVRTQFDPADHDAFLAAGPHTLRGQAFMRQRGGGVVTCAGSRVNLWPATTYMKELMLAARSGARITNLSPLPESHRAMIRTTTCDAQGAFRFEGLPAGKWFAFASVQWAVGNAMQGGTLARAVESGQPQPPIILTERDFATR